VTIIIEKGGNIMIGMVLSGHGNFPSGMYSSLKLIAGEQEKFAVVDFTEDMGSEELRIALEEGVNAVDGAQGVVIFTDIQGGTPFNRSVLICSEKKGIKVVAGTNLPLLIAAIDNRNLPLFTFVDKVMEAGQEGMMEFIPKTKTEEAHERHIRTLL